MMERARRSLPSARDLTSRYGALGAVLALGLALRLRGITEWWLNPDEGIYYSILTLPDFAAFWHEVSGHAHPPLYYLILRGLGFVSWDFLWLRMFSVLCGIAGIVAICAVARELGRTGPETDTGDGGALRNGQIAGLIAALVIAMSPPAIVLSQVIRPYTLLLMLLAAALFCLLRYRNGGGERLLVAYVALVVLALLTHYSAVLALTAFGLIVLHEGIRGGPRSPRSIRLALAQVIPGVLVLALYFFHVRDLTETALADDALTGWLNPYMIDAPLDIWLGFLGVHHLAANYWLVGPAALLTLGAVVWSAMSRDRTLAVVTGGALLVGATVASLGVYPFGSTRHSAWLLIFTAPAIGWIGESVISAARAGGHRARAAVALFLLLMLAGGPIGLAIGAMSAPWAPSDQLLRADDLTQMVDFLDPEGIPEVIVMSEQTYYQFLPFYGAERLSAVESADGSIYHFSYGQREILVNSAWHFTLKGDRAARSSFVRFFPEADQAFPSLRLREREKFVLLEGGWRPPFVTELLALGEAQKIGDGFRAVRGFHAFELDMPRLLDALGVTPTQ